MGLAVRVGQGEIRRGLANLGPGGAQRDNTEGRSQRGAGETTE